MVGGHSAHDVAMQVMISSRSMSNLLHSSSSSYYTLRQAENVKFTKDIRNKEPIHKSNKPRLISLANNQCGRRGPLLEVALKEFASLLIKRSTAWCLLDGPFAVPPSVALFKVLSCCGSRLTWIAQREHVAQVVGAVETPKSTTYFLSIVQGYSTSS